MPRRIKHRAASPDDQPFDPNAPTLGDFWPDGSWNPEGIRPEKNPARHLYWFVDMLVTKRKQDPACAPYRFASRINSSPFSRAFLNAIDTSPTNRVRWTAEVPGKEGLVPIPFILVGTGSAAETAVKYAGHGASMEQIVAIHEREVLGRPDLNVDEMFVRNFLAGRL